MKDDQGQGQPPGALMPLSTLISLWLKIGTLWTWRRELQKPRRTPGRQCMVSCFSRRRPVASQPPERVFYFTFRSELMVNFWSQ